MLCYVGMTSYIAGGHGPMAAFTYLTAAAAAAATGTGL
jgi:hypothetical protein